MDEARQTRSTNRAMFDSALQLIAFYTLFIQKQFSTGLRCKKT